METQIFELGRRHKIMNPDKMRTTYGKLIYLLQVASDNFIVQFHVLMPQAGQSSTRSQGPT